MNVNEDVLYIVVQRFSQFTFLGKVPVVFPLAFFVSRGAIGHCTLMEGVAVTVAVASASIFMENDFSVER